MFPLEHSCSSSCIFYNLLMWTFLLSESFASNNVSDEFSSPRLPQSQIIHRKNSTLLNPFFFPIYARMMWYEIQNINNFGHFTCYIYVDLCRLLLIWWPQLVARRNRVRILGSADVRLGPLSGESYPRGGPWQRQYAPEYQLSKEHCCT